MLSKRFLTVMTLLAVASLAVQCTPKVKPPASTPVPSATATATPTITPSLTPGLNPGTTPGSPASTTPQQGEIIIPVKADTYTDKFQPDHTAASDQTFYVYGKNSRAYLQFPLNDVPKGAVITNATLKLNMQSNSMAVGNDLNVSLYQNNPAVALNDYNWNNQPDPLNGAPVDTATLKSFNGSSQQSQDIIDITELVQYFWDGTPEDLILYLLLSGEWTYDFSQEWFAMESGMGPTLVIRFSVR